MNKRISPNLKFKNSKIWPKRWPNIFSTKVTRHLFFMSNDEVAIIKEKNI
jgi:hypothetical protein